MSFLSYAQNFEDVILWRALKHIKKGCYVDVGAQEPIIDSVSKAFYEHGWRGINIEPVPKYAELLRKDRPEDVVLEIALGDINGSLELYLIPDTGLTTAFKETALRHYSERGFQNQQINVPVRTLTNALNFKQNQDIHWLKIDVEGFEEQVLKGWDSKTIRPWIMVVEATLPNSTQSNHETWEHILISADYHFVYFDGLNRFYVAVEHPELLDSFKSPPNCFDDFNITQDSLLAKQLITNHQLAIERLRLELNHEIEKRQQIYYSHSWKITAPLRQISLIYRWFWSRTRGILKRIKRLSQKIVVKKMLEYHPLLQTVTEANNLQDLSPHASRIHTLLQNTIKE